jgi:hypothetical protein
MGSIRPNYQVFFSHCYVLRANLLFKELLSDDDDVPMAPESEDNDEEPLTVSLMI